jgi:hypothetical protein
LPAKLLNRDTYARSHHRGSTRRSRHTSRTSPPRGSRESSDGENKPPGKEPPPVPAMNPAFESGRPPTPPAKDTPPDSRFAAQPPSPLRRAPPSDHLREDYGARNDDDSKMQFPAFALSPSPSKPSSAGAGNSPTTYLPCTADEYRRLITGAPLPWAALAKEQSSPKQQNDHGGELADAAPKDHWRHEEQYDSHSAPLVGENAASMQLPCPDRWSEEPKYNQSSRRYSPLPPRFYTPSNRSVQPFAEGETPSKNVSTPPLLPLLPLTYHGGAAAPSLFPYPLGVCPPSPPLFCFLDSTQ